MLENLFASFNAYLMSHPAFLMKLKLLFWVKYWALTLLMAFFVYLIYRERGVGDRSLDREPAASSGYDTFEA